MQEQYSANVAVAYSQTHTLPRVQPRPPLALISARIAILEQMWGVEPTFSYLARVAALEAHIGMPHQNGEGTLTDRVSQLERAAATGGL